MPPLDYASEARRFQRRIFVSSGACIAFVLTATLLIITSNPLPPWVGPSIGLLSMIPLIYNLVGGYRFAWKHEGVEQQVYAHASSIAFAATLLLCAFYGMLEAFAGAPRVSVWWFYCAGVVAWVGATLLFTKRLS